ncbi:MAG: CmcI family methyltransferase [Kiloniellaceae bacterium]
MSTEGLDRKPGPPGALKGEALRTAAEALAAEVQAKVRERQGGVRTFFDNFLLRSLEELRRLGPGVAWEDSAARLPGPRGERVRARLERLRRFLDRRSKGRFVDYHDRLPVLPEADPWPSDIDRPTLAMSQGTAECLRWRGLPLFKTAFDFAVYPMLLWDLRPRTVVELGSGSGASAVWLAELMALFGGGHVYSLDLKRPDVRHDAVTFLEGDCGEIETALDAEFLRALPHPWLAIEDAHVNVHGVLAHLHAHLAPGDYLIVEDSLEKRADIGRFLSERPGAYKVDTRYTDFFGRNATCAFDSIFVRN